MTPECFALLDDASPDGTEQSRSRLYTGHAGTLVCRDFATWPQLLEQMRQALARGQYAVTLCSYELGEHLQQLPPRQRRQPGPTPLAQILLFERCQQLSAAEVGDWLAARSFPTERPAGIAQVHANVTRDAFGAALARIHAYIEQGDTYQVNYTYRLRFEAFGTLCALYARLRARQPVPYGALVALDDGTAVLSLSPELFVRHADGVLTARPMKGTAPAAPSGPGQPAENARRAAALAADPKNRAENLMIVDLLRNDIGRIAQTGTVEVPALFEVSRYSSVLQMTSTVQARLHPDATLADIFLALYPCGSITGAPKRRTMEIIGELEADPRGLYTGAIGWFDPPATATATAGAPARMQTDMQADTQADTQTDMQTSAQVGNFCLSVPIRTLALAAERNGVRQGEMGVGAGIVFDSDTAEEFAECSLKARFLTGLANDFELFETMYATRANGVRHRARHLARLAASATWFGYTFDAGAADAYLDAACAMLTGEQPWRLRLALGPSGAFAVQHAPLAPLAEPVRVLLAADATSASDLFLRHKSSVRARYDAAWRDAEAQGGFDTLFFNERGELTEGGRSNVFVKLDGQWYTPPLACGLLPGVMRGVLLEDPAWQARERVITRAMLAQAQEIVLCNALRGPLRAVLQTAP